MILLILCILTSMNEIWTSSVVLSHLTNLITLPYMLIQVVVSNHMNAISTVNPYIILYSYSRHIADAGLGFTCVTQIDNIIVLLTVPVLYKIITILSQDKYQDKYFKIVSSYSIATISLSAIILNLIFKFNFK